MVLRVSYLLAYGCALVAVNCASIVDNRITETPRIKNGEDLISAIANDCFDGNTMNCLKGKVLTYLDTVLGLREEQARSFEEQNVDKVIYERVARIMATNEFKVTLPETVFAKTTVSYRADRGLDFDLPQEEARGDLLKKKLLLPVLLLLKLKMKALMPILLAIVGLKAMKALILSKLAITLVLGFIIYNLVKKTGLGMPMAMAPMMPPADPMSAYGAPAPAAPSPAPSSSYDPASWEPSNGGPYSRVWEPSSASSAQNLAYSAYYPGSSSSSSGSSSSITSGSSSSSATASAY